MLNALRATVFEVLNGMITDPQNSGDLDESSPSVEIAYYYLELYGNFTLS